MFGTFERLYEVVIYNHRKGTTFIILASFLITFIIARILIYLMDQQILPDWYILLGQTHIHHFNYGIFLLTATGYLSLVFHTRRFAQKLAIFFGIGLGLTFDEFSLWFHLENNYYSKISYDMVVVITGILINIVYLSDLWRKIFQFLLGRRYPFEDNSNTPEINHKSN